jgi:hypothetical protein
MAAPSSRPQQSEAALADEALGCQGEAMADEPQNSVLEHLRHIRGVVDAIREDILELRRNQAALLRIVANHESHQVRVEESLGRIERRLELTNPAIIG